METNTIQILTRPSVERNYRGFTEKCYDRIKCSVSVSYAVAAPEKASENKSNTDSVYHVGEKEYTIEKVYKVYF